MVEHIYLYNTKLSNLIYIYNVNKIIADEIKLSFETFTKEENKTFQNNQINLIIKKQKKNNGIYYSDTTPELLVSLFTLNEPNDELYFSICREILENEYLIKNTDNKENFNSILEKCINKISNNENNILHMKDTDRKDDPENKQNLPYKSINLSEFNDTLEIESNRIELKKNYGRTNSLRLFLILLFVFIGIGVAIILPFVV